MDAVQDISFSAPEYQVDQSIQLVQYRYYGSVTQGWNIEREGQPWLLLGPGYVPVRTRFCGICSTDLTRHHLPFPLPQVTGHEVIGEYLGEPVAIEINASHAARGLIDTPCEYCQTGLDIHCPERLTLGIDRLPGGFSPWVLAPVRAIKKLPDTVNPQAAVLLEPFAAALKAVTISAPQPGDRVAVLGPRRLGMLIIAALDSIRKLSGTQFEIIALMRHAELKSTAEALGADEVTFITPTADKNLAGQYDIVFDTTGGPQGFELALALASRTVHVKSTHGREVVGLAYLTSMVINEQQIAVLDERNLIRLQAKLDKQAGTGYIYIAPGLLNEQCIAVCDVNKLQLATSIERLDALPQRLFDFAIVDSLQDINLLTRPLTPQGQSLLKAGGTILVTEQAGQGGGSKLLARLVERRLQIETSRCGSFDLALDIFQQLPVLVGTLQKYLITHSMDVDHLHEAMQLAAQSDKSIKVMIKTG